MSAQLLLRLFQSEYFNVHLAVSYLRTYKDSVGITYYLAQRLAQVDEAELEFYWPQLCHLLVSHASESGALEGLIIKKCEESIHLAMLTLWQMQASLSDLSSNPSTTSFATCRRLYNRAQHIIFSDALLESSAEACNTRRKLKSQRVKPSLVGMGIAIAAIAQPRLAAFQGQIAIEEGRKQQASSDYAQQDLFDPSLSDSEGSDGEVKGSSSKKTKSSTTMPSMSKSNAALQGLKAQFSRATTSSANADLPSSSLRGSSPSYLPGAPLPLADMSSTSAGILTSTHTRSKPDFLLHKAAIRRTSSAVPSPSYLDVASARPSHSHSMVNLPTPSTSSRSPYSRPRNSQNAHKLDDRARSSGSVLKPLILDNSATRTIDYTNSVHSSKARQIRNSTTPLASPRLAASTPSLHPYSSSASSLSQTRLGAELSLPPETISLLLRSYACRSQLDLITSLQDIATRLIVVPRLARLSALRAELTVLNHGLPRGCCLCLGCAGQGTGSLVSTDNGPSENRISSIAASLSSFFTRSDPSKARRAHHRIVRISPSESVVLNSADRAPFLIHVEILEGDLDFDPNRRQNAEDIRSVMAEREGKISKARNSSIEPVDPTTTQTDAPQYQERSKHHFPDMHNFEDSTDAANDETFDKLEGVSEVSAVDSPQLPENQDAGNKEHLVPEEVDLVEQMYGSFSVHDAAALPVGEYHPNIHNRSVDEKAWRRAESRKSFHARTISGADGNASSSTTQNGTEASPVRSPRRREPLSIDEYAERMRMAAIMLAQLNASQQVPLTGTDAVTGAVGAGVGMGVNLTYGVGSVVGSVVGVGVDAVRASLGSKRRTSITATSLASDSAGQGSAGLSAPVDDSTAIAGLSNVSGTINPASFPEGIRSPQTLSQANLKNSASTSPTIPASRSIRQRVLSAQEASAIRERIMSEMMSLEDERMSRMKGVNRSERVPMMASGAPGETVEEESIVMRAINKDDPSGSVLSESWLDKKSRIRKGSPYGHLLSWDVFSVIVKTGADLRQEQLAVQLIKEFGRIWTETSCPHWVRYFRILVTSESTGLMETITDAVSVHSIKKEAYSKIAASDAVQGGYLPSYTLYDHFVAEFGQPDTARYRKAQDAFLKSLASYSVITYLLQIKDRHNGNILVDKQGHLMHIDFGFMLSNSPGSLGFEMAPFKLSQDYVDILGGIQGPKFLEYRALLKRLFRDIRQHAERIVTLVELMQTGSKLPCFDNGVATVQQLRERFQLGLSLPQLDEHVDRLVLSSAGSAFTRLYDTFQRHSQGVL